jgi:aspartate racemase
LKKLGIIGGISWASTAIYYETINRGVASRLGGLHSASLIIDSLDLAPVAAMQLAGEWDKLAELGIASARRLEQAGAEGLVMTSNTMHHAYDAVASEVSIPVLHIADAAASKLVADNRTRVALLGTEFTMSQPFVRQRYEDRGIQFMPIDAAWRNEVHRIIYEELAAGRVVRESQRKLKTLITELGKRKTQAIVLGCTELVLAVDVRANVLPVYDTTAIHARSAVEWMLGDEEQARAAA